MAVRVQQLHINSIYYTTAIMLLALELNFKNLKKVAAVPSGSLII